MRADLRSLGGARPNNSMQRTVQRTAADAERYAASAIGDMSEVKTL